MAVKRQPIKLGRKSPSGANRIHRTSKKFIATRKKGRFRPATGVKGNGSVEPRALLFRVNVCMGSNATGMKHSVPVANHPLGGGGESPDNDDSKIRSAFGRHCSGPLKGMAIGWFYHDSQLEKTLGMQGLFFFVGSGIVFWRTQMLVSATPIGSGNPSHSRAR